MHGDSLNLGTSLGGGPGAQSRNAGDSKLDSGVDDYDMLMNNEIDMSG